MAHNNIEGDLEALVREICTKAINEYADIIVGIANDIYDSCIAQYYATYTPSVYKRHGRIEGFNLYDANSFEFDGSVLSDFDGGNPWALLRYGARTDIRAEVLQAVLSGQRGITKRPSGWPRGWDASYPNEYSQYNYWHSNFNTIEDIINDFETNIIDDTSDLLDELIDKYSK